MLVLDHRHALRRRGWRALLSDALHEFAHAIRFGLDETGVYPTITRLEEIRAYLDVAIERAPTSETALAIPQLRTFRDYNLGDLKAALIGSRKHRIAPLFGRWRLETRQCDDGHDLLFYLLLYVLDRKARAAGLFKLKHPVATSVYAPNIPPVRRTRISKALLEDLKR